MGSISPYATEGYSALCDGVCITTKKSLPIFSVEIFTIYITYKF